MKKHIFIYSLILFYALYVIVSSCSSIIKVGFGTSAPWYVGLLYPAIYYTLASLLYACFIQLKFRYKVPLILSGMIVISQLLVLFLNM